MLHTLPPMHYKIISNYKQAKTWGFCLLALLLLFVTHTRDFKATAPGHKSQRSLILQQSFQNAEVFFQGNDVLRKTYSSLTAKVISYRKRFKHLIEGNDDHSPYIKELQYSRYLTPNVQLSYEPPFFISEQQSSLYRLSVF